MRDVIVISKADHQRHLRLCCNLMVEQWLFFKRDQSGNALDFPQVGSTLQCTLSVHTQPSIPGLFFPLRMSRGFNFSFIPRSAHVRGCLRICGLVGTFLQRNRPKLAAICHGVGTIPAVQAYYKDKTGPRNKMWSNFRSFTGAASQAKL